MGYIVEAFQQVIDFVEEHPSAKLESLHVSFDPSVSISYTVKNGLFAGYDRDGPMYEDADCSVKTTQFPPTSFLCLLKEESRAKFDTAFHHLLEGHVWASVSFPPELQLYETDQAEEIWTYLRSLT
jgi:hypothetical protein